MNLSIRKCSEIDLAELQQLAINTFSTAFSHMNTAETMEKYLKDSFNSEKLLSELQNENSSFYFVYFDNVLAGYIKLNEFEAQTDIKETTSFEIERIYVKKEFSGKGIGSKLIEFSVKQAQQKNKEYVWLGVWEKNKKAIEFYKRNGFAKSGEHIFVMGDEAQTDFIMKKNIE